MPDLVEVLALLVAAVAAGIMIGRALTGDTKGMIKWGIVYYALFIFLILTGCDTSVPYEVPEEQQVVTPLPDKIPQTAQESELEPDLMPELPVEQTYEAAVDEIVAEVPQPIQLSSGIQGTVTYTYEQTWTNPTRGNPVPLMVLVATAEWEDIAEGYTVYIDGRLESLLVFPTYVYTQTQVGQQAYFVQDNPWYVDIQIEPWEGELSDPLPWVAGE